jgi:hypothetical protein
MRNETFYSTICAGDPSPPHRARGRVVGIRQHPHAAGHKPDPDELKHQYARDKPPMRRPRPAHRNGQVVPLVAGPFCTVAVLVMTRFVAWGNWVISSR